MSASPDAGFIYMDRDPEEHLQLQELLGEGAYGAVYRALSPSKEGGSELQEVAVKIIPADDDAAELKKEINIMLTCQSPFIVQLHSCYYKDHEAWLVMDFCGGGSCCDILDGCRMTMQEDEVRCAIAWSVLGLDYLHSNKKLHRDVKAGNVLLSLNGQGKLADFGVSKEVSTMQNKAQTVIGTPYWMAPEVIQEVPYDGRADVWSLAITAIEMAEGNPPLHKVHPMRAIFMIPSKPPPTLKEPEKWSPEFNAFIAACLVKKPEDRPTSAELLGHPWLAEEVRGIQKSGGHTGSKILQDLVSRNLERLKAFRLQTSQAKADAEAANLVASKTEDGRQATLRSNLSVSQDTCSPQRSTAATGSSSTASASTSGSLRQGSLTQANLASLAGVTEKEENDAELDDDSTGSCVRVGNDVYEDIDSGDGDVSFKETLPRGDSFKVSLSRQQHKAEASNNLRAATKYFQKSAAGGGSDTAVKENNDLLDDGLDIPGAVGDEVRAEVKRMSLEMEALKQQQVEDRRILDECYDRKTLQLEEDIRKIKEKGKRLSIRQESSGS
ncbi:unnamed protein product [Chrysoparadoxa australica]